MSRTLVLVLLVGLLSASALGQSTLTVGITQTTRASWDPVVTQFQAAGGAKVTLRAYSESDLTQQILVQGLLRSGQMNLVMVNQSWAQSVQSYLADLTSYQAALAQQGAQVVTLGGRPVGVSLPFSSGWFLAVLSWPANRQDAVNFLAAAAKAGGTSSPSTPSVSPQAAIAAFGVTKIDRSQHNSKLDGSLEALLGAVRASLGTVAANLASLLPPAAQQALSRLAGLYGIPFTTATSTVTVTLETAVGQGTSANVAALAALGVSQSAIETSGSLIKVHVSLSQLATIATQLAGVTFIRPPYVPYALSVTSQGVAAIGANALQAAGITGSGVKVAIIDLGFAGLSAAQARGDLPAGVQQNDLTGTGIETGISHGTAVAEIVYDVAPGAQLYLIKIADEVDLDQAVTYCLANGIRIINHSLGWYNTNFYDGTGTIADIARRAIAGGILWVNAVGNQAQGHWLGTFADSNTDGWNDQSLTLSATTGSQIILYMTWNDWPNSSNDYDLYLYDPSSNLVASSTKNQTGMEEPTEAIFTTASSTGTYTVRIKGAGSRRISLFSLYENVSPAVASSAILTPADVTEVVSVGAIDYAHYTTGPQEPFSSQGPTTDGRQKPDLCAPDNVSTGTSPYTTFAGTSGAAPHAAGAAALLLSNEPSLSGAALRSRLLAQTVGMGNVNIYGQGRLLLTQPAPPNQPPAAAFTISPASPIVGQMVTFDASGSVDPDGTIVSYAWSFGTGATGTGRTAGYTYSSPGTYTVGLTVTDNSAATGTATQSVTVVAAPQPDLLITSLTHTPTNPAIGQTITWSVVVGNQGSAPAGSFRVYLSGAASSTYAIVSGLAASASTTLSLSLPLSQGTETFTAVVDDLGQVAESNEFNNTAQDVVTAAAIQPVVAQAGGPYTGTVGQNVSFNGSGSSGPITGYQWAFGDGSSGQGVTIVHAYGAAGTYTATLTVTGSSGQQATDTAQVTVGSTPRPDLVITSFTHSPTNPTIGQVTTFAIGVRNQGNAPAGAFRVRLSGAFSSAYANVSGLAASASTTLSLSLAPSQSTETFTAMVDDLGQVSESNESNNTAQDVVVALAPQPVVAEADGPYAGTAGQSITLNASGSSGPITSFLWNFGDGLTAQGVTVAHTYGSPGTYTATLTVTGSGGQQSTDTTQVTVNQPVAALSVHLSLAKGTYQVGENILIGYTVNRDAYVYICNVDVTGAVVLVFPNLNEPNPHVSAGAHVVPAAAYNLTISGPTGGETLYAFAATGPLGSFPTTFGTGFPTLAYGGSAFRTSVRQTMQSQFAAGDWADDTLSYTTTPAAPTTGTIQVTSSPSGASVTLDGVPSGTTPVSLTVTPGTHTIVLSLAGYQSATRQATLIAGQTAPVSVALTPITTNQPPVATFGISPAGPTVGQTVTFDGSGSHDNDGTIVSYVWDFGDGTGGPGPASVTHTFASAQSYLVRLTVTDNNGATNTASQSLSVTSALPPLPDLRAYWAFNEGSGRSAADSSGNGNTGNTWSAIWCASADSGSALLFLNVPDSIVQVSNSPSLNPTSQLTVEAWIRPQALRGQTVVVDKIYRTGGTSNHQYALVTQGTEVGFYVMLGNSLQSVTSSGAGLVAGVWYHIAGSYDGTSLRVYVNGVEKGSRSASGSITAYDTRLYIGRIGDTDRQKYTGVIDEVKIHARAVPPSEFTLPPNAGVAPGGNIPPVVAFTYSPLQPHVDQAIAFSSSASYDPDGTIVSLSWQFSDGSSSTSARPTKAFSAPGTYTVTLKATDNLGAVSTATQTIIVVP